MSDLSSDQLAQLEAMSPEDQERFVALMNEIEPSDLDSSLDQAAAKLAAAADSLGCDADVDSEPRVVELDPRVDAAVRALRMLAQARMQLETHLVFDGPNYPLIPVLFQGMCQAAQSAVRAVSDLNDRLAIEDEQLLARYAIDRLKGTHGSLTLEAAHRVLARVRP